MQKAKNWICLICYLSNIRFNTKRFKERIMGKYLIISLMHSNKTSFKKNSGNIQFDEIYFINESALFTEWRHLILTN